MAASAVLLLVGLPGLCIAARAYVADHLVEVRNGETVRLTAVEGRRATVAVRMSKSLNGYWAAPGGVVLSAGGQDDDTVVAARAPWWRDSVLVGRTAEELVVVRGTISAPRLSGTGSRTMTGTLRGVVSYPAPAFAAGQFRNAEEELRVPVEITVVPAADARAPTGPAAVLAFVLADLAVASMLTVLAAAKWAVAVAGRRRKPPRARRRSGTGLVLLLGAGLSGVLILFTLSAVLQLASGLYRTLYERAVLDAPGLIIWAPITVPALIWLAAVLGMTAAATAGAAPRGAGVG